MAARKSIFCALLLLSSSHLLAVEYKCKDDFGHWSEQACPDYQARQKQAAAEAAKDAAIRQWEPRVGMHADEILAVTEDPDCSAKTGGLTSLLWCTKCVHINTTKNQHGTHEQWVFGCEGLGVRSYLYFDNGVLTSIQN